MADVFVSYARATEPQAKAIADALREGRATASGATTRLPAHRHMRRSSRSG